MESILNHMCDQSFNGKINDAAKSDTKNDSCPVFTHNSMYFHQHMMTTPYYNHNLISYTFNSGNSLGSIHYSPQVTILTEKDAAYKEACSLLDKCKSSNGHSDDSKLDLTRINAEKAINLIETHKLTGFNHSCRNLVYFPDLLERFLQIQRTTGALISEDDIGSMIARCIEVNISKESCLSKFNYSAKSLEHLLNFKGELPIEIKLLPKKYEINQELYQIAKIQKVQDSYYDAVLEGNKYTYQHLDVVAKEKLGQYTGFRDAYHCLLYGDKSHLQALIVRWDLWGDDCTADAAREFYNLDKDCPIQPLIGRINEKTLNM